MSEEDDSEREFDPTPHKLEEARRKGDIVRSSEITVAAAYGGILHIGRFYETRPERLRERQHPPPEAVPLIGEAKLGPGRMHRLGNAPGDGMIVCDAEDQRPLAREEGVRHALQP